MGAVVASSLVLRLEADVEALVEREAADVPGPVALADTRLVLRLVDRLRAASAALLADVDRRQLFALEDAGSTTSWVRSQPSASGRDTVALARRLERVPFVAAQVRAGQLALEPAGLVARALEEAGRLLDRPDGLAGGHDGEQVLRHVVVVGVLDLCCVAVGGLADDDAALAALVQQLDVVVGLPLPQRARLERALVLLAQRVPLTMLRESLDRLVEALRPERLEREADRAHDQRGLVLRRRPDGSGYVLTRGDLSLEVGELLSVVLAAERATDPDAPADTAAWARREEAPLGPGPRSRAQQDHDALGRTLRRLLDRGALGLRDKVAPHLAVTVGLETLLDVPGTLPAVSDANGAVLPAGLVRRLLCDGRLTRVVLGLGRRVREVSHSARTATAHERRELHVRWGGRCAEAGCPSPPGTALTPHHVQPFAEVGHTAIDDTVPICEVTHRDVHVGRRSVTLRDGRRIGPHGWLGPPGRLEPGGTRRHERLSVRSAACSGRCGTPRPTTPRPARRCTPRTSRGRPCRSRPCRRPRRRCGTGSRGRSRRTPGWCWSRTTGSSGTRTAGPSRRGRRTGGRARSASTSTRTAGAAGAVVRCTPSCCPGSRDGATARRSPG